MENQNIFDEMIRLCTFTSQHKNNPIQQFCYKKSQTNIEMRKLPRGHKIHCVIFFALALTLIEYSLDRESVQENTKPKWIGIGKIDPAKL